MHIHDGWCGDRVVTGDESHCRINSPPLLVVVAAATFLFGMFEAPTWTVGGWIIGCRFEVGDGDWPLSVDIIHHHPFGTRQHKNNQKGKGGCPKDCRLERAHGWAAPATSSDGAACILSVALITVG